MAKSKRLNPIIIEDPEDGKEYTLEFNRKSVRKAESAGLNISQVEAKSMTMLPLLFWASFLMHHPYMTQEKADKILFEGLGGLSEAELTRLGELYAEPFNTLILSEDEKGENPRKMTVKL